MLTPAGQEAAARARVIVSEVEQLKEAARRSRDPEAGTVRLGIFPTLGRTCCRMIPRIRERFPELELLLVEEKSDVLLDRLREGKLDAALLALPVIDDQLHAEFLFEEPFLLAVSGRHPLARREHLDVQELATQKLLLLEDGIACATRRWKSAARSAPTRSPNSAPPAWKPCARWSPLTSASPCCRACRCSHRCRARTTSACSISPARVVPAAASP